MFTQAKNSMGFRGSRFFYHLWLVALLSFTIFPRPLLADSHPLSDSLEHWQNTRQFKSICRAADSLINSTDIPACLKMQLLLAASKAPVDLYQPKDWLKYAKAVSQIPPQDFPDTLARMEALLQEAFALNMLEEVEKAVPLTEKVINFSEKTRNESLLIRAYTHLGMMLNKTGAFDSARKMFQKHTSWQNPIRNCRELPPASPIWLFAISILSNFIQA